MGPGYTLAGFQDARSDADVDSPVNITNAKDLETANQAAVHTLVDNPAVYN